MSAVAPKDRARLAELGKLHDLWSPNDEPVLLAWGAENTTIAVGDYIVRCSADHEALNREVHLLDTLAHVTSVPIPIPVLYEAELGTFVYRRLRGTPLLRRRKRDSTEVRQAIIDALSAFRRFLPASQLPADRYPYHAWHQDAVRSYRAVRGHLSAGQGRLIRAFLNEPPPPTRSLLIAQHNDLGAEHILVDDHGTVTGIIDWTDVALTDPARDIGSIYRDLGPEAASHIGEALNGPLTEDELHRIRFHARCRWLEDVVFGLRDPLSRRPYLDNAWRAFEHTFGSAS